MFFITLAIFVVLLGVGLWLGEIGWKAVGVHLLLAGASVGMIVLFNWPLMLLCVVLALLDILLILMIFKSDIPI